MNLPTNPLEYTTLQQSLPKKFYNYVTNMHLDVSYLISLTRLKVLMETVTTSDLEQFTYGLENLQRNIVRLLESVKVMQQEKENDG